MYITISDLNTEVLSPLPNTSKVPAIIQALENNNSSISDIYNFFNNEDNLKIIKCSPYVKDSFFYLISLSEKIKEKILLAIDLPYNEGRNTANSEYFICQTFFTGSGFIPTAELYNSLIRRNLVNIKIAIANTLPKDLYDVLNLLDIDNLKKLFDRMIPEDNFIDNFILVFDQCLHESNFKLIEKLFMLDILVIKFLKSEVFATDPYRHINALFAGRQGKVLSKILVLYSEIQNTTRKNILHYASICNDKQALEKIIYTQRTSRYCINI